MLLAVVATATQAQTEPEYRLEIGAGGGAYLNQLPCKYISDTQISACNDIAYSFKWFLNSTATPTRYKTHSLAIKEIWGVKDA